MSKKWYNKEVRQGDINPRELVRVQQYQYIKKGGVVLDIVDELLKDLGSKEADYIAQSVYEFLLAQDRYDPSKIPLIKDYALAYNDLMKIQRVVNKRGYLDDEDRTNKIKDKNLLGKRMQSIFKDLGLHEVTKQKEGSVEEVVVDVTKLFR